MWTRPQLEADLRRLGVCPGDLLFIHSSFKSLGTVCGGVETVIEALAATVGPGGMILMPSFHLIEMAERPRQWNRASTPSSVGWITECFRRLPATCRSDHYSHSVAAQGPGAATFVADHRSQLGLVSPWDRRPWGRTYGTHSPMYRAYERGGKLLMLGVDYESSTYCHLVEVILWNRRLALDPEAQYIGLDRHEVGALWDGMGRMRRRGVGDADCRLFDIADYVDTMVAAIEPDPSPFRSRRR